MTKTVETNCQKLLKTLTKRGYDQTSTLTKLLLLLGMKFCIKIQQRAMKNYLWLYPLAELSKILDT